MCDDSDWPIIFEKDENGCIIRAVSQSKRIYYTSIIILLFFFPFLIMLVTYSIMIHKLWRNQEEVDAMVKSTNNKEHLLKNQKRGIIMLVAILITFFMSWSPLELMILYQEYNHEV